MPGYLGELWGLWKPTEIIVLLHDYDNGYGHHHLLEDVV
jgi:hypothetical protein